MAFKMKGPGLPGYRKQVGRGFYKKNPFNINTSNRSPMKENGEKDLKEADMSVKDIADANWNKLRRQGVKEEDINWDEILIESNTEYNENQEIRREKRSQFGMYLEEMESTGRTFPQAWEELPDNKKQEFGDIENFKKEAKKWTIEQTKEIPVHRGSEQVDVTEIIPDPETEWTNVKIRTSAAGMMIGDPKFDVNDKSNRMDLSLVNGTPWGQISNEDIKNLVKSGKFKYEKDRTGELTGNILMSKDYHDNVHAKQLGKVEEGKDNREAWQKESYNFKIAQRKKIAEELKNAGIKKDKLIGGGRRKEWDEAYNAAWKEVQKSRPDIWNEKINNNPKSPNYGSSSFTHYGDNPPWMKGDANYGGVQPGIYNDDEVLHNTGKPGSLGTNANFYGNENLQGHRLNDWVRDESTGKLVLKDDALTLEKNAWNDLSIEEKSGFLKKQVEASKKLDKDANKEGGDGPGTYAATYAEEERKLISDPSKVSTGVGEETDIEEVRINEKEIK